jgi:hypothetical protein
MAAKKLWLTLLIILPFGEISTGIMSGGEKLEIVFTFGTNKNRKKKVCGSRIFLFQKHLVANSMQSKKNPRQIGRDLNCKNFSTILCVDLDCVASPFLAVLSVAERQPRFLAI